MSGVFVINQILDNIVKGGKQIIKDKSINRQKVPPYTSRRVDLLNIESVIHGGYNQEPTNRNGFFSLRKDPQPQTAPKDGFGSTRANIDKQKIVNSKQKNIKDNKRTNFSGLKSSRYKSGGFSPIKAEGNKSKQKQNCFIKLEEDNKNRIVIERVKIRESIEEDKLRAQKQNTIIKQYQQRKANQLFDKEKIEKHQSGVKQLKQHIGKGNDHSFAFDDQGQPFLFKKSQNSFAKNYPYSINFKFESEDDHLDFDYPIDERVFTKRKYSKRSKAVNQSQMIEPQPKINQHQRIRSARGQAFSSAVLKTVNLSRISINQSLREIQIEQFMKRNDLFNNNHTRQTTSIPYLQPKVGTVYTQLSTNQIIGDNTPMHQKISENNNSQTTKSRHFTKRKSHFEPYKNQDFSEDSKSFNLFEQKAKFNAQDPHKIQTRPLRTAQGYTRRSLNSERRPKTSVAKGRITTANEDLVIALIE